ncbi:MAG: BACON domain-containing protein [Bacteroidales bacterium]|nr:BACON domain-containing protein [Bacteroidales bacterium]MBR4498680.1 BACON domain-containing protein [Bacteroidales bacterium]
MKRIFKNFLLLSIVVAMFTACSKEKNETPKPDDKKSETVLSVSTMELNFDKKESSGDVTITTSEAWTVEIPVDWISVEPMEGNGSGKITISVSENNDDVLRSSYVTINTKSDSKNVTIMQTALHDGGGDNGGGNPQQGTVAVEGAINAFFSVSPSRKVYFSQGNLQYQASTNTWRFAENQYDIIGEENTNISSTYEGWIDLFCWATSGWNNGKTRAYQPYSTSTKISDYDFYGANKDNGLFGDYANCDWGVYNAISNGGKQAGLWRTLTSNEWEYLILWRTDAKRMMGQAVVNGVTGLVLLPDDWTLPSGISFVCKDDNIYSSYYVNKYTIEDWSKMETNGAVFLPAAGFRNGTDMDGIGLKGIYWSSQVSWDDNHAGDLYFDKGTVKKSYCERSLGVSVRLVHEVE